MFTLTITFDPKTREVTVSGPITDKMLCYGMLGMATETLQQQGQKKPGPELYVAHGQFPANGN